MKELNQEPSNWKLLIVGEGSERNNIVKQIEKYNLGDKIILTGFIDNVNDYLVQAEI